MHAMAQALYPQTGGTPPLKKSILVTSLDFEITLGMASLMMWPCQANKIFVVLRI